jgi:hypothetical protein
MLYRKSLRRKIEYIEGKRVYILKSGETSSIYLSRLLTTLFDLDISKDY